MKTFLITLLFSLSSTAQTNLNKVEPTAMAQYVEGSAIKTSGSKEKSVVYNTLFFNNDTITVPEKSIVKLVTRNLCQLVIYGPSKIVVPKVDAAWFTDEGSSLRALCPTKKSLQLKIGTAQVTINGHGEALYADDQLVVIHSPVFNAKTEMKPLNVYTQDNESFILNAKAPYEIWLFDQRFKKTKESFVWQSKKEKAKYQISVGPVFGIGKIDHKNDFFSQAGLNIEGAHLQLKHLPTGWNLGFTYFGARDENSPCSEFMGPPPNTPECNHLENVIIDIGKQSPLTSKLHYYYKVGYLEANHFIDQHFTGSVSSTYHFSHRYDYNAIRLSLGLEYNYTFESFSNFGLKVDAEATLIQTLSLENYGFHDSYSGGGSVVPPPDLASAQDGLRYLGMNFHIGVYYNF